MQQPIQVHPSYPPVTGKILRTIVARIRKAGSPIKIVMFGSHARGDYKPWSDLDILVIEPDSSNIEEKRSVYQKAVSGVYPNINLFVYPIIEVEKWRFVRSHLLTQALRQGKLLYEDSFALQEFESQYASLCVAEGEPAHKTPADLARAWFEKGNEHFDACHILLEQERSLPLVCFLAQQAAEFYMKGFMALHGVEIKTTHKLDELEKHFDVFNQIPFLKEVALDGISSYAVRGRYDFGFAPLIDEAEDAIELATKIMDAVLEHVPSEAKPHSDTGITEKSDPGSG